jgi:cation:H+ antiporter
MALWDLVLLAGGVALLLGGAVALVQGGSSLAKRIGISPLWVGLTIVGLGTSAPELVVSSIASWQGNSGVAFGNVVGSNILNILVVLGITAVLVPVAVQSTVIRRDIAILAALSVLTFLFALNGRIGQLEGLILFACLFPFLWFIYWREKHAYAPGFEPLVGMDRKPLYLQIGAVVLGILLLASGGRLVVDSATDLARAIGVTDRVIGLTVVAIGTSLPELATSIVAAIRREVDLAIGNIIGSNILNLVMVLGVAALIGPVQVLRNGLILDLPVMLLAVLLLWFMAGTRHRVSRQEGFVLLGVYVRYAVLMLIGIIDL